jgi:hypothetical protein
MPICGQELLIWGELHSKLLVFFPLEMSNRWPKNSDGSMKSFRSLLVNYTMGFCHSRAFDGQCWPYGIKPFGVDMIMKVLLCFQVIQ